MPGFFLECEGKRLDGQRSLGALRKRLEKAGVAPGTTLAALAGDRLQDLLLVLLCASLKMRLAILDPALPEAWRRALLEAAGARHLIREPLSPAAAGRSESWPGADELKGMRLLLATSGSTGEPRLVELSGANLLAGAGAANRLLGLRRGDRWLACLPTHHVGGVAILFRCLLAGAGLVLHRRFRAGAVLEALYQRSITHLSLVPTMLERLLARDPGFRPPASLRVVLLGGAPAAPDLVEEALARGWPVCPSYGLTEAASQVATCHPPPGRWTVGLAGRPLDHLQVRTDDEGRILIRGPSVARHWLDARGRHPLTDAEGWLHTRDLGRLDGEGRLVVLGREDDLLISGGEKIHPASLEGELRRCPGIEEVAVTGVPDPRWGTRLLACYRGPWEEPAVAQWAATELAGPYKPKEFRRLDRLPRNAMGKLLRRKLQRICETEERRSAGLDG